MTEPAASGPGATPRDDILVSVCLPELGADPDAFAAVRAVADAIGRAFRFWEIVALVDAERTDAFRPLLGSVANLRLCSLRHGIGHYRRRVIVAEEAIGDIVVLARLDELAGLDVAALVARADATGNMVIPVRGDPSSLERSARSTLAALGWASGYKVDPRFLATVAIPRSLLNPLLRKPDAELALRFPPRDLAGSMSYLPLPERGPRARTAGDLPRRIYLLQRLLVNIAPRLLIYVSLASGLLSLLGFAYALYVVGVWLTLDDVAPGWITLSAVTSATAVFMGTAIFGLSLGLQFLLQRLQGGAQDDVLEELNTIDVFAPVRDELNIEIDTGVAAAPARADRTP